MKAINWKDKLISLGICGTVIGSCAYLNYINSNQVNTFNTNKITASASDNNVDIVTENVNGDINQMDSTTDDNSPFVNDDYMKDTVEKSEPKIGMTYDQVINSSWGNTSDKSTTKSSYGTSALWMYGGGKSIFFIDGKVESITEK